MDNIGQLRTFYRPLTLIGKTDQRYLAQFDKSHYTELFAFLKEIKQTSDTVLKLLAEKNEYEISQVVIDPKGTVSFCLKEQPSILTKTELRFISYKREYTRIDYLEW